VAATTWMEYKKYFETDAALKRRFQVVKVDEPDEERAIRMMRGLTGMLEKHHKVEILEEAVADSVKLSHRYITDRQLPDKCVSLLDTACAKVALGQSATPAALEDCRREIEHLDVELGILEREQAVGAKHDERLAELTEKKQATQERRTQAELAAKEKELRTRQGETPRVQPVVDGQAVAEVVSGWTGIPLGKMVRDEIKTVLTLRERLEERIIGQSHALEAIAQRIRTARANLLDPRRPIGVCMMV